ncbi:hypothetical protein [Vagococcus sp.]|uniref:hypothetical protein n=1 Tax=Vagococcus sp. TaxID=1933889 RepID=UPI003F964600
MGTLILSMVIFFFVGWVIYEYGVKKKSACDCSSVTCPVKQKQEPKKLKNQNNH